MRWNINEKTIIGATCFERHFSLFLRLHVLYAPVKRTRWQSLVRFQQNDAPSPVSKYKCISLILFLSLLSTLLLFLTFLFIHAFYVPKDFWLTEFV
jgi:hypothetical protein